MKWTIEMVRDIIIAAFVGTSFGVIVMVAIALICTGAETLARMVCS